MNDNSIPAEWTKIMQADLSAFVYDGALVRKFRSGDEDCARTDVEIWTGTTWDSIVCESLTWEKHLAIELPLYRERMKAAA